MSVQNISESLYVGMCLNIGTPQQLACRRDIMEIAAKIYKVMSNKGVTMMLSGSRREGFRLRESDVDLMFWRNNHRVIWKFSQYQLYNTQENTLILCDSSDSPPGFTLLELPFKTADNIVLSVCVRMGESFYISSFKQRLVTCNLIRSDSTPHGPCRRSIKTVHGPCSGSMVFFYDGLQYDYVHCFVSEFWPPSASSWIDRCHSWPPPQVVKNIVRNGCHFVPIGHKLGNHKDEEWRISFSQAEYKLVYSMNHTQFLTYGLLKLFLKEIINKDLENELLCSYFMKTAVFWAIQQNALLHWRPNTLLICFWVCFKLLLKWVYEGVCPNFFIPENNMFLSNIHGSAQGRLFLGLYKLYEKGISLLLHSNSIRSYIINVLCNPRLTICTDEHTLISEVEFDNDIFREVFWHDSLGTPDLRKFDKYLHMVEQLIGLPMAQYHICMLQKLTATIFQRAAFILLQNIFNNTGPNKRLYVVDKIAFYMLKLTAKFGFVSDMLYIVMYYYKTFRYRDALSVIDLTMVKLAQPYLMYDSHVDSERYIEAVGGQSLSTKMRQAVAQDIRLKNDIFYINELMQEQQSSNINSWTELHIPPPVLLHMLEFLCSRHVDTLRAQRALDDLQVLVHHDQGELIPKYSRDISWNILGICQQISGNLHAALYSYQQSVKQYQFHEIQCATRQRIWDLHL